MYNTKGNQWVIPEMGLLDIPPHLLRTAKGWGIVTDADTWWRWDDVDHGYNYMESLRVAGPFAVTIGSLASEETRECIKLMHENRLTQTGVLGVFHRSGLKEAYHVIVDGQNVRFPYNDGKGFMVAVKAVSKIMSATTKHFIERVGVEAKVKLP